MKKYFILALLLFTFAFNLFAQDDARASVAWRVLGYKITANVPQNPGDRYLTVKAAIDMQNIGTGTGARMTLRINENAEVSAVQTNGSAATFSKGQEAVGSRNIQRIIVNVPSVSPNAKVSVVVDYKLKVNENSGLNSISPVNSQFLPLSFWYPTPNSHYASRGADFAPFTLNVTAPNETVISSGTQSGTNFDQKLNAQPFFITGSWDKVETKGVSVFLPKGATDSEKQRANELAGLAAEASTFAASLLGTAQNVPLKIVAVRRGSGFSDAGVILLDNGAFRRQKVDANTALTIADAVTKIWLGNLKTVRGGGYGVIREGLSRYIATQFIEKQFGKEAADNERFRQRSAYAAVAGNEAGYNQAAPLDPTYYSSVANKGAMIWRLLAQQLGQQPLFNAVKTQDSYTLQTLRNALPAPSALFDDALVNTNELNLLVGLPQTAGGETKAALRNTGNFPVNVNIIATTDKGEKLNATATLQPKSFGEVAFKTASKIVRTEIDPEKYYPQTDFSDDVAPREFTDSNPLIAVKRAFDKQDYAATEKSARLILQSQPSLDDARVWLGRALLAQNKNADAEKEFQAALNGKLPTQNTLGWANVGLGEIAAKSNQSAVSAKYFDEAIKADAEYGATLAARSARQKLGSAGPSDESVRAFFSQFDKAASGGRKADLDALVLAGETGKFASGIGGQAEQWQTKLVRVDNIDANNAVAEVSLNIKLLNREPETGTAVFYLSKVQNNWRLSGVEIFEVK